MRVLDADFTEFCNVCIVAHVLRYLVYLSVLRFCMFKLISIQYSFIFDKTTLGQMLRRHAIKLYPPSFARRPVSSCLLSRPLRVRNIINSDSEGRGEANHVTAGYQDRLVNRYEYVCDCLGKLLSLGHRGWPGLNQRSPLCPVTRLTL